jgi:hypothetical protein
MHAALLDPLPAVELQSVAGILNAQMHGCVRALRRRRNDFSYRQ